MSELMGEEAGKFEIRDDVKKFIEDQIAGQFALLLQAATAAHIQTLQRVNDQAGSIFAVATAQMASGAVKQETIVQAIADAIRAMPPDKLIEFVRATGADITNINVTSPAGRSLAQTMGDGSIDY